VKEERERKWARQRQRHEQDGEEESIHGGGQATSPVILRKRTPAPIP
jgi:hypothetical protein